MIYLKEYHEKLKSVSDILKIINNFIEVLFKDKSLKSFLKIVLVIGNFLNTVRL